MSVAEIKTELPKLTAKELVELEIAVELAKNSVQPPVKPSDYFGCMRGTVKFLRRLAQEAGYTVDESKAGGVRLVTVAGNGETWAMWASSGHVIKLGGRGRTGVPDALIEWYGDRYPSSMPAGVMEGPLPPGAEPTPDPDLPYDPDAPTPDWDGYDPTKTKTPGASK